MIINYECTAFSLATSKDMTLIKPFIHADWEKEMNTNVDTVT